MTAGRSVLFPAKNDDPAAIAHGIEAIIHDGADAQAALARIDEVRGSTLDWLSKLFK